MISKDIFVTIKTSQLSINVGAYVHLLIAEISAGVAAAPISHGSVASKSYSGLLLHLDPELLDGLTPFQTSYAPLFLPSVAPTRPDPTRALKLGPLLSLLMEKKNWVVFVWTRTSSKKKKNVQNRTIPILNRKIVRRRSTQFVRAA